MIEQISFAFTNPDHYTRSAISICFLYDLRNRYPFPVKDAVKTLVTDAFTMKDNALDRITNLLGDRGGCAE
jgi:hypothetical protein